LDKGKKEALPKTLAEFVYLNLKKLIIDGKLKPNQRITQKEITDLFNVSSSPVREAIHRLCADRLLKRSERKYVLVQPISYEEVKQLYELVRVLDSYALTKCILAFTDKEMNDLKILTEELSHYRENNDEKNFIKINLKIHDRIWQNCENTFLYEILHQLVEKVEIHIVREDYMPFRRPGALEKSCKEHLQIMKAIENRDLKTLEKIMQTHWGQELFVEGDSDKKMSPLENVPAD
jgi:DNA-binding GntR family transcriptional regulator